MPNKSKTGATRQEVRKDTSDAKTVAKKAERDASKALSDAEKAKGFAADAIQKAADAAEEIARSKTSGGKTSLNQAGSAITEAKEAIETAESARSQAESARNKAEEARFAAEKVRNIAEEARVGAEETRTEAENIRGSEEDARIKAESSRRKAEEAKRQADIALKNSELAIAESEQARIEAERARDKANAAMRGLMKRQKELKEYASSLETINKDLEQFATVASHDLQAPLRKIITFSEQVEAEAKAKLSAKSVDFLQRTRKSAQAMQVLIKDLLALARVSHLGLLAPVDLSKTVADVLSKLDEQIAQNRAVVEVGPMFTVMGDNTLLEQLIQNLIENALKFQSGDTPPVIKISSSCPSKESCQVSVRDNGIGFDQEQAERIFEPFERLHGMSAYQGTGIGLAICKRIAERHGGDISAESTPGKGTVFTVTLPLQQD